MKVVPYALDVGSIACYAVYHTGSVPCHESVKGYKGDPGMDHMTAVKIILSGIRKYFSIMEVTKRFVVKGYVDASFDTDLDDSKSQSRYILKVGAIS